LDINRVQALNIALKNRSGPVDDAEFEAETLDDRSEDGKAAEAAATDGSEEKRVGSTKKSYASQVADILNKVKLEYDVRNAASSANDPGNGIAKLNGHAAETVGSLSQRFFDHFIQSFVYFSEAVESCGAKHENKATTI
jgi:hypothetical protein